MSDDKDACCKDMAMAMSFPISAAAQGMSTASFGARLLGQDQALAPTGDLACGMSYYHYAACEPEGWRAVVLTP